jgi:DNA-binding transcriptional regulator/RsmH inhibitor MraZ
MAAAVVVDRQGRFSLTPAQMAYARITDRILLVGGYLTIALWAPEVWESTRQAPAQANRMLRAGAARPDDLGEAFRRAMGVQTPP